MKNKRLMIVLFLLLITFQAQGQSAPPGVLPNMPYSGQNLTFQMSLFSCIFPEENPDGLLSNVIINGNQVDLYLSVFYPPCGVPPPGPIVTYSIGAFAEGDYHLSVYLVPSADSFPTDPAGLTVTFEQDFSVGPLPAPVPIMNPAGLLLMILMLLGLGIVFTQLRGQWSK